jgi:pyridoxal phosphate enzyme (YggS family)
MAVNKEKYTAIKEQLAGSGVTMVAVSKLKPVADILELYALGHRDFGENYVQELLDKHSQLPKDIRWHFIGHLQTNKVKFLVPFIHLIHGVDSWKLLAEINKQALKNERIINVLLQMYIAQEETKFGLDEVELKDVIASLADVPSKGIRIKGFMGMASFSNNQDQLKKEFQYLKSQFDQYKILRTSNIDFEILSMGMSSDYKIAIKEGSNLVRIGSLLFGERQYSI